MPKKNRNELLIPDIRQKTRFAQLILFFCETTNDLIGKMGSFHINEFVAVYFQMSFLSSLQTGKKSKL